MCLHVGRAGLLVGCRGEVRGVVIAALLKLDRSEAIFRSVGSDRHCFCLYPYHNGLPLKHPHLFSEVLVGLRTHHLFFIVCRQHSLTAGTYKQTISNDPIKIGGVYVFYLLCISFRLEGDEPVIIVYKLTAQ